MTDRSNITQMLSKLTEKRLSSRYDMWAAEVEFDKNTNNEIRIDYMGFKAKRVHMHTCHSSVELGSFDCYEIKSCMADYKSGHGLNFIGDNNFIVTTREVAEQIRGKTYGIEVLVPDKPCKKLITCFSGNTDYIARERPASEMLWQMCRAHNNRVIAYADAQAANGASQPIFNSAC